MKTAILLIFSLFVAGLAQERDDPSVQRVSRFKILTGEGRLKNSVLLVKLRQDQRFTRSDTYFVTATVIDSSTGLGPDSIRAFAIRNLANNQFTIRSVQRGDTCRIRWLAVGE